MAEGSPGFPCMRSASEKRPNSVIVTISHVSTNAVTYSGVSTSVDVIRKEHRVPRTEGGSNAGNQGTVLDRQPLQLQEGTREYAVADCHISRKERGFRRTPFTVSALPGELTEKNNRQTFTARIRKSKLRILIVAGAPSPDVAIVRQTLHEVEQFTVQSFTQTPSGGFYEGTLPQSSADSADCLFLLGFPSRHNTGGSSATCSFASVSARRPPVLIQVSRSTDLSRLDRWATLLPFSTRGSRLAAEVRGDGRGDGSWNDDPGAHTDPEGGDPWAQLPPLFTLRLPLRVHPDAIVHATRARGQMSGACYPLATRATSAGADSSPSWRVAMAPHGTALPVHGDVLSGISLQRRALADRIR